MVRMAEEHEIRSLADALEVVTPENIDLFLADLREWFAVQWIVAEAGDGVVTTPPVLTWKDDGVVGMSELRIRARKARSTKGENDG